MAGIKVEGISVRLDDKQILENVSFKADQGHLLTVIGPSGGGKTTLFRCMLGEVAPDRGRILLDGTDVTSYSIEKRRIGTVYQSYALFPHMTVAENVGYGLRVHRTPRNERDARVREMLDLVGLTEKASAYPKRLSGGERQRVAVARALAVKPEALLLDEAFTALDATTRHQVVEEVRGLIKKMKLTTLLITHDQEEAFLFARRVLVLNEGRVVTVGDPEAIMRHPNPFIQDFVKMLIFRTAKVEKDPSGDNCIFLDDQTKIAVRMPGVEAGDVVHVMVKKGPATEHIRMWTDGK